MKKILLTIIGLAMASPAWSSQTAVTEISGIQPSVGALKTQVNTKLGTVESNRQDHETRVASMESGKEPKAVVQASAPADTTVDWYDTDQESGVLILKRHNGTTWLRASSHGVQYASSCASITAGMCVDTDDGKLYYHNGTSVVEVGSGGSVDLSAYLSKTNTTAFTPSGDYHPATKKYVDDSITAGGGYTDEQAQDAAGGMFSGNTETGITVTYNDTTGKVDFVVATQSDVNFTSTLNTKLAGIAAGAEVNVNADWNSASGDSQILNKPATSPLTASMITGVFTGTGDCLGSNGEKVACGSGGAVSDTAYGSSWDGVTDTAPSKNVVYDKIEALALGGVTVQSADPTSASASGWYAATGSGDIFYKSSAGLFTLAGSYVADPVTRTLAITSPSNGTITCSDADLSAAINCGTGGSACSATTADNASITGVTATADSGYALSAWTGDLSGTTNPTTLTMSANRAISATFSVEQTYEGSTCSGYTVCQNFEGTGYDNSEVWYEYASGGGGTINEDQTASPLRGLQSIELYAGTSGNISFAYKMFTAVTSGSEHFIFSTASAPTVNNSLIFSLRDTGGADKITIQLNTSRYARIEHGGVFSSYTTTAINNGDHIWLDWANGTGSNGTVSMYVSANGTKPSTPYATITTGANTTAIDRVGVWATNVMTNNFDFVLQKDTIIGSVVE